MSRVLAVLKLLNDREKSMLICCGTWGPRWVNDKPGPKFSEKTFRLLHDGGFIKPLIRVQRAGEGPWYTISPEGKKFLGKR